MKLNLRKVLISDSSKHQEKQETRTLALHNSNNVNHNHAPHVDSLKFASR